MVIDFVAKDRERIKFSMDKDIRNKLEKIKVIKKDTDIRKLSDFIDSNNLLFAGKNDKQGIVKKFAFMILQHYSEAAYTELSDELMSVKPNKRQPVINLAADMLKSELNLLFDKNAFCMKQKKGAFSYDCLITVVNKEAYDEWQVLAKLFEDMYKLSILFADSYDSNYGVVVICDDNDFEKAYEKAVVDALR